MNRIITHILPVLLALVAVTAHAAEKIWTGATGSSWNTAANWLPTGVPITTDDVIFDGTVSSSDCSLPASVIVRNLDVLPTYTGTISGMNQSSAILTVAQVMQLSGGTLSTGLSKLKVMGQLWIDGGTLNKGSVGICSIIDLKISSGSFTIQDAPVEILGNFLLEGGTFQSGSGSFVVKTSFQQSGGSFSKTAGVGTFNPTGNLSISGGSFDCQNASITFKSLALSNAIFNGGAGFVYFNGNLDITSASFLKTSGAVYMNAASTFTATDATINLGTSAFNANDLNVSGGTANFGSGSLIVNGNATFINTNITKPAGNSNFGSSYSLSAETSSIVFGTGLLNIGKLSLEASLFNGGSNTLNVEGNISISGASQFTKTSGFAQLSLNGQLTMTDGEVNLSGCSQINTGQWNQSAGTFVCGSSPMQVRGNLELSGTSVFTAPAALLDLQGSFRLISGTFNHNAGTLRMSGTASTTYSILGGPVFNMLEITNTAGVNPKTVEVYGTVQINQNFSLKNGSVANRAIRLNNGTLNLLSNLNISDYRCSEINPGTATLLFSGSSTQTIVGTSTNTGLGVLPSVFIDKTGGVVQLTNNVCFGNGFGHQNANIEFDPAMVLEMAGGSFSVENLLIPKVRVTGTATLTSAMVVLGNLELLASGFLMNGSNALNINGDLINEGRFQNMNGSLNVTGLLSNKGEFAANSGSMNALTGITQESGVFSCGTGQVNSLGTLTINNGSFNCASGAVVVSGTLNQNGGQLNGNTNGGTLIVSQNFNQLAGIYNAQSGVLNIGGTLNLSGTFIRGTGTVNFNGFGPQAIPALFYNKLAIAGSGRLITLASGEIRIAATTGGFAPNASNLYTTTNNTINYNNNGSQDVTGFAYNNLTVSRTGTKSILANASVKNTLRVINSAVLDADGVSNNRVLTLISNQNQTARIDQITSTASIVGNLTFQRWTRGGIRSNRFIASPVDTVGGIKFKQVKDNVLLFGPGNSANGFDNPSIYLTNVWLFNETLANGSEWRSPASTSEVLPTGTGFLLYHLGDRTQSGSSLPNATTIDFKGVPNQGLLNLPVSCTGGCIPTDNGNGWNLIANPYASPIDWDSPEWTKNGISSTIYIWNPRINQYASYNSANPGAATNGGSRYIGPGQAFFMKATENGPVLTARETIKTSQFPDTLLFRVGAPQEQLRLLISEKGTETQDEAVLEFRDQATEGFDAAFDANKPELPGMSLSFALMNETGDALSVHALAKPELEVSDKIIPIRLKADAASYEISASQLESFGTDVVFYLEDRLSKTIVRLEEGKYYALDVTSDPATFATGRLNLILRHNRSTSIIPSGLALRVFPNPANGSNVQVVLPKAGRGSLEVYDMLGARLMNRTMEVTQNTVQLDALAQLSSGVYTIVWTTQEGRYSERLTIK